ncbi:MAG: outer membrane lipoprotein-sorting protein [Treponema sp.]|nr:outer membrane lipoprotein-sorting protein [Treponema sp.]
MKKISIAIVSLLLTAAMAFADQAYDIVQKAKDLDEAPSGTYTCSLILTDRKGNQRVREAVAYMWKDGEVDKSVMAFRTPKDVAGVSYLSWEYPDNPDGTTKDSDSWLYMPAMKKVRRIAGSGKKDDFMGTDFTYEDIGERSIHKDTYKLLGEENVAGKACWKIEALAKDKTEKNPRSILYIAKDNYVVYKKEYFDRQNNLQRILDVQRVELVDGYWTSEKMFMQNVQSKHSTLFEMKDINFSWKTDQSLFTVNALERQAIR